MKLGGEIMGTYQGTLPQVFPFNYVMDKELCVSCVDELMGHGSSFAVTVEPSNERLHLWLSFESNSHLLIERLIVV